jgi:curli biogenesis system outer membrane secretion channel CsgG
MKSALPLMILYLAATFPSAAHAQSESSTAPERPAVAVLDFDYGAVREHWPAVQRGRGSSAMPAIESLDVGKGVADLLVAELVNGGHLRVIERQRLADVSREQQGGDRVRARYLIMGSVTKFGGEQKTRAAAVAMTLIGIATHMPLAGLVSTKKTYANVDLSCRIVDTVTGEIVGTTTGAGQSRRSGVLLGGLGGRTVGGGGIRVDSADFQATILGEATANAVKDAAGRLRTLLAQNAAAGN